MEVLEGRNLGLMQESFENLTGVREIVCDPREDGTIAGMHAVDGYYKVGTSEIRQIRTYDVKTSEEARLRAIEDGLTRGILVEQYLGEKEQCALCMNSTTMTI